MSEATSKGSCKCPAKDQPSLSLAIATIPSQPLGELYDLKTALQYGTLFKNLDLPFFMGTDEVIPNSKDTGKKSARQELMDKLNEVSFALSELSLYLDTHPTDETALELFRDYREERKILLLQFAHDFEPLTCDCVDIPISDETKADTMYPDVTHFTWVDGPLPWEGGLA
ncbi:MAG: spore coat protein CotJB [Clostridium sp.]|jgi:spore coat protein JB|nr:spore coat protein CotJB [Clostridium sp.]